MRRRRVHRIVFISAGVYNILWGVWSVADPQWLFRYAGMPLSNYPPLFACLGMIVGLYGCSNPDDSAQRAGGAATRRY